MFPDITFQIYGNKFDRAVDLRLEADGMRVVGHHSEITLHVIWRRSKYQDHVCILSQSNDHGFTKFAGAYMLVHENSLVDFDMDSNPWFLHAFRIFNTNPSNPDTGSKRANNEYGNGKRLHINE